MSPPRLDLLARLLQRRPLTVELDGALERRLRAYVDRLNHADPELQLDPDNDGDLASALAGAAEGGIEADERAHGLAGSIFGDLLSADVMDEGVRRRRERRERERQARDDDRGER